MLNLIDMMSIYHRVPKFILRRLWNHARIRSWHQPVLSKEGKVSCWGKNGFFDSVRTTSPRRKYALLWGSKCGLTIKGENYITFVEKILYIHNQIVWSQRCWLYNINTWDCQKIHVSMFVVLPESRFAHKWDWTGSTRYCTWSYLSHAT